MSITDLKEHDATCVRRLVEKAIEEGYCLSLCDGMEDTVLRSDSVNVLLDAAGTTDVDYIYVHRKDDKETIGTFCLIYGNSPGETINDHTDNDVCLELYNYANEPWKDAF